MRDYSAKDSATNCVAVTTAIPVTSTSTTFAIARAGMDGTNVPCGGTVSVSTMPNSALQFYQTTVDNTTPQPVTFSVCGSQAVSSGLKVYEQTHNITTGAPMLKLYDETPSTQAATPCFVAAPHSGMTAVAGFNVSVSL